MFVIIDLGSFQTNLIYAQFIGQFFNFINLVLIGFYNQKLKNNVGRPGLQFLFPANDSSQDVSNLAFSVSI